TSAAGHRAARRGAGNGSVGTLAAVGGGLLLLLVAVGIGMNSKPPRQVSDGGGGGGVVVDDGPEVVDDPATSRLSRDLRVLLANAQAYGGGASSAARIRSLIEELKGKRLSVTQAQLLDRAEKVAKQLEDPGGKKAKARQIDEDWERLAGEFLAVVGECLVQPRSAIHMGAETVRNMDLREVLRDQLREVEVGGAKPQAVIGLVASADLHPVLGVGGYDGLLSAIADAPAELRETELWKSKWSTIVPHLEKLRDVANAYGQALMGAEIAAEVGNHDAATKAFREGPYADDPWFKAALAYLDEPQIVASFRRTKELWERGGDPEQGGDTTGGPVAGTGRTPTGGGGADTPATIARIGGTWEERFLRLEGEYRKAVEAQRPGYASQLGEVLDETLGLCRSDFKTCREVIAFYDEHERVFREEAELKAKLKLHHELYFAGAFAAASGPMTFRALDDWCDGHGYVAWRSQLKPYLRLLASANDSGARAREGRRQQRAQVIATVREFEEKRLSSVEEGLESVIKWLRRQNFAPDAVKKELDEVIARGVERAGNSVGGKRLRAQLQSLPHTEPENAKKLLAGYQKQLQGVIDAAVADSLKAVERCLSAGEPGQAFDLFAYILRLDPENERAHKALGHEPVKGKWAELTDKRWLRKFEALQLKQGLVWDEKLAWIKIEDKARYEKGEVFDLQHGRWSTLAEANRTHSSPADPWVLKTEHFELRSTADLDVSARTSERLEAFYLAMFRQYDLFFGNGAGALIFGVAKNTKPLIVNFYRDEQQFRANANPPTGWAAGFYSGGQHASFFYDIQGSSANITVLQHEVTHQILGETAGGGGAMAWLAEGAAVYLEDAFFKDGGLVLGEMRHHQRVSTYAGNLRNGGNEHSLKTMITDYVTSAQWDSGDIATNYRGAGAAVYFLCNFDEGRYRADFVEFLRDAYRGQRPNLSTYFGLPEDTLSLLQERFYNPKADILKKAGAGAGSGGDLTELSATMVAASKGSGKGKEVDLDQLTQAYGDLRKALTGAPEKEADKARKSAGKALVSMRKRLIKDVRDAAKKAASGAAKQKRYLELVRLRKEAWDIIHDTSAYPDENHGAVGQHLVDAKVDALRAFWEQVPAELEEPEIKSALEILGATEPWLAELELEDRKRGESSAELAEEVKRLVHPGRIPATPEEAKRFERDAKVREYNASRTDFPEDVREQVRILNDYRDMLGVHALALEERLVTTARGHSEWMERTGNFDHNSTLPGRRTPQDRANANGYTAGVGENIAYGYNSAEAVHLGWYNSSGHHRNMVNPNFHEIGVGRSGTYWTQNFGTRKPPFLN
ncbi:MAG: CAP domain-containing protein, partial [Planctomycetes bacterium]|nr:CAP domain-containing protein [Planctomycetota bacterium]